MSPSRETVAVPSTPIDLQVCIYRGALCLVGQEINRIAMSWLAEVPSNRRAFQESRDGPGQFHITILSAQEFKANQSALTNEYLSLAGTLIPLSMGLSVIGESYYVAVHCDAAQRFRAQFQLGYKHLHITLGFHHSDSHGPSAESSSLLFDSMVEWESIETLFPRVELLCQEGEMMTECSPKLTRERRLILTHIVDTLIHNKERHELSSIAIFDALKRIAKHFLKDGYHTEDSMEKASVAEDIAWFLIEKGYIFGIRLLLTVWNRTKSQSSLSVLLAQFPKTVNSAVWNKIRSNVETRSHLAYTAIEESIREINILIMNQFAEEWERLGRAVICLDRFEGKFVIESLPRNFSWISLSPWLEEYSSASQNPLANKLFSGSLLAGCAMPASKKHMLALYGIGIRHVLTIHEHKLSFSQWVTQCKYRPAEGFASINAVHFECADRTPPSASQMRQMISMLFDWIVVRREPVVVHCLGGVGRTNTVIVAFLMALARGQLAPHDGTVRVAAVRKLIFSVSQEETLRQWYRRVISNADEIIPNPMSVTVAQEPIATCTATDPNQNQTNDLTSETLVRESVPLSSYADCRLRSDALRLPPVIMMCGLPASGKSTVSTVLATRFSGFYRRINRDEMRGKGECDEKLREYLRPFLRQSQTHSYRNRKTLAPSQPHCVQNVVILDGCHITKSKRSEWLDAVHNVPTWCIAFELPIEECKRRMMNRTNHPTIVNPKAGIAIIDKMSKQFESPKASEGFERVIYVRTEEDFLDLLRMFEIPREALQLDDSDEEKDEDTPEDGAVERVFEPIGTSLFNRCKPIKFPRTSHALNLGAATRDDKILSLSDVEKWIGLTSATKSTLPIPRIIVEEKVDGANMGFSISSAENRILVQNRSHFISSQYHAQFAPLDKWLGKHGQELWTILEPDRHILYGEWLHATHSVEYDQLTDMFLAFDIFDAVENVFLSRAQLSQRLQGTTIQQVPLIYEGVLHSVEQLRSFVTGPSHFSSCQSREGVVIRLCDDTTVIARAKLVRSDFIAGNERWNRSTKLQVNKVVH